MGSGDAVQLLKSSGDAAIHSAFHAYSLLLKQIPEDIAPRISAWDLVSKGPKLAQGWMRHDDAILRMMIILPEAQLFRQNAERKANLRLRMRQRLERTKSKLRDLTVGHDEDAMFDDTVGYSV